jgi:hypothetical protein
MRAAGLLSAHAGGVPTWRHLVRLGEESSAHVVSGVAQARSQRARRRCALLPLPCLHDSQATPVPHIPFLLHAWVGAGKRTAGRLVTRLQGASRRSFR